MSVKRTGLPPVGLTLVTFCTCGTTAPRLPCVDEVQWTVGASVWSVWPRVYDHVAEGVERIEGVDRVFRSMR